MYIGCPKKSVRNNLLNHSYSNYYENNYYNEIETTSIHFISNKIKRLSIIVVTHRGHIPVKGRLNKEIL